MDRNRIQEMRDALAEELASLVEKYRAADAGLAALLPEGEREATLSTSNTHNRPVKPPTPKLESLPLLDKPPPEIEKPTRADLIVKVFERVKRPMKIAEIRADLKDLGDGKNMSDQVFFNAIYTALKRAADRFVVVRKGVWDLKANHPELANTVADGADD